MSIDRFTSGGSRGVWILVVTFLLMVSPGMVSGRCGDGAVDSGAPACCGDVNDDGAVTIDEIVLFMNIALGGSPIPAGNGLAVCCGGVSDGACVTVDVVVTLIDTALHGCPSAQDGSGEECDDGGICIGGPSAGQSCAGEADCEGDDGVCHGGLLAGRACDSDESCDGGACIKCKPFGGDGCAANCTAETEVPFRLVPGAYGSTTTCEENTSCADGYAFVSTFDPRLSGEVTLVVGAERDGLVPAIIRPFRLPAGRNHYVGTCLSGVVLATCGGTLFEADGAPSPSCTEGLPDRVECPMERPCAATFGPGNVATGEIGCAGLAGADVRSITDCMVPPEGLPGPQQLVREGSSLPGSAFFYSSVSLDTGTYPDGPIDPAAVCAAPPNRLRLLLPLTTASSDSFGLNPFQGGFLGADEQGRPFRCSDLTNGIVTGTSLVGATALCEADLAGWRWPEVALPFKLVAQ